MSDIRGDIARLEGRFDRLERRMDDRFDRLDTKFGWLVGVVLALVVATVGARLQR